MSIVERRSIWSRLYNGETHIDFMGRKKLWFALSSALILAGVVSLFTQGLNLGLDFEGGTAWEVPVEDVSVDDARDALGPVGNTARVQTLRSSEGTRLRVQAGPDEADTEEVRSDLAELAGVDEDEVSVTDVGPSWGDEITRKAQRALVIFLIVITLYITLRFEWKMALATLAALIHDILVTVGVYSLFRFEVTPATVIALLTILGYSIYDGIVVFDRIDENARGVGSKMSYGGMVNASLNQVLMRTLNTSITALIPIASLLVVGSYLLGATTLEEFALALLVGLAASAYSSIFIASPVLAMLKEREPKYRALRTRDDQGAMRDVLRPAAATKAATGRRGARTGAVATDVEQRERLEDDEDGGGEPDAASERPSRPTRPTSRSVPYGSGGPPRGRKKGKRR